MDGQLNKASSVQFSAGQIRDGWRGATSLPAENLKLKTKNKIHPRPQTRS
jgi:hypothetical protein